MEKAIKINRIVLGLLLIVFGINGFLQFIPMPEPSAEMGAFLGALAATGYIFPLIAVIQLGTGLLLIADKYVPLALVIVSPVMANALLAHLFLHDISGIGAVALVTILIVFLFFSYRNTYFELLTPNRYENA